MIFQSIVFLLITSLFSTAQAKVEKKEDATTIQYDFLIKQAITAPVVMDGKTYTKLRMQDADNYDAIYYKQGFPEIPVVRLFIEDENPIIQFDEKIVKTSVLKASVVPNQPSQIKLPDQPIIFSMNEQAYHQNSFYPKETYKVEKAGSINGKKRYLLTLFPIKYNPVSNTYRLHLKFSVKSKKNLKAESKNNKKLFAFIVGEKFKDSPSLLRYVDFKKSLGYEIDILLVKTNVRDIPNMVRKHLKDLYLNTNAKLSYALIIGESSDVPGFDSEIISGTTDHYYRAIDTDNYTQDINGPDIGVGRFSPRTEEDLSNMVEKSIIYYNRKSLSGPWLKQAAFLATDDQYVIAEGTHNYVIDNYMSKAGYTGIFPETPSLGGDKLYEITYSVPNNIVQAALHEGRAIINYSGHGGTTEWEAPKVTPEDVLAIRNDALPFVISNACITGNFRFWESFSETWQRHRYGSIFFWGSMDNTYWGEDDILEKKMFDAIFQYRLSSFKDITQYALSELWRHYGGDGFSNYYWETYTSMGDPSLDLAL